MRSKLTALFLSAVMALSLFGCGAAESQSAQSTVSSVSQAASSASTSESTVAAAFPVTVTDAAGREVTIEEEPKTLVSGYYITTSMLIALDQQDKLAGIDAKAKSRPIYGLAAPELLELPSVGTAKEFDLEGCAALNPDLVILPMKLKDTIPALEELGIQVLLVRPENMEQLNETIELLGTATGSSDKAAALLAYNQETDAELETLLNGAEKPTVYLAGNSNYLSTAGAKMYQNTVIELGGGVNVAAELEDNYWADVSYEQLLAWNPEVIVIAANADYTKDDILNDAQLADLDAVKNGKVYALPSAFEAWDSPVPSAMLGARWMASTLHPDLYALESMQKDTTDFYSTFYGFEADAELVTQ